MDKETTQSERKQNWLTEGLVIASVPVSVYILMLSFVIGYCDFFRIPVSFASLNLPTMLWIGLRLEFGLFFMLIFTTLAYLLLRSHAHRIASAIPFAGLLLLQIALRLPWRDLLWALLALAITIAGSIPLSFLRHSPGPPPSIALSPYTLNMIRRALLVLAWLGISSSVAESMGRSVAANQRDYLVPASAPTTVVLWYFGETLVVAPFDRSTKEVEQSFWVIKTGEDPKRLLRWESVGPLHSKPEGGSSSTPAPATTPTQPPKP